MTAPPAENRNHLSSLKRGLQALALLNARENLTVTQLARELGLPRTTAHRILDTLAATGYAERLPYTTIYKITPVASTLSNHFSDESWIIHVASPVLLKATQDLHWSFSISTRTDENMIVRLSTDRGAHNAITYFSPGVRNSVLETVCGHVMLAYASQPEREAIMQRLCHSSMAARSIARVDPVTHETVMEPVSQIIAAGGLAEHVKDVVAEIVEHTLADGYSHIIGKTIIEAAVAAPITLQGRVSAAIVMRYIKSAVPIERVREEYVPLLHALSAQIAERVEQMKTEYSAVRG